MGHGVADARKSFVLMKQIIFFRPTGANWKISIQCRKILPRAVAPSLCARGLQRASK